MDFKKYWPYLILVLGAIFSIVIAFISIQNLRDPDETATSTEAVATSSVVVAPAAPQQESKFMQTLRNLFTFRNLAPPLPATRTAPPNSSGTYYTSPTNTTGNQNTPAVPPEPSTRPSQYNYTFAPAEVPPTPRAQYPQPADVVRLNHFVSTGNGNPNYEYVILTAPQTNQKPLVITGMKLRSAVTGNSAVIGNGVTPFLEGQQNSEGAIALKPGSVAYIFTGRSPLSYSFQLNKCMGFLNQFYAFTPGISTYCPLIQSHQLPKFPNNFDDNCLDYLSRLGQCYDHAVQPFPSYIKPECQSFILERNNYRYCVSHHRSDSDFEIRDWRIYLNRSQVLWKTYREHIELYDQNGKLVDGFTY